MKTIYFSQIILSLHTILQYCHIWCPDLGVQPHQVLFTAFTGTAVLNMRQENACTLHSLLYKPILRFGKVVGFKSKAEEDLVEDLASIRLIIADEFSMIPDDMLTALEHICRRIWNIAIAGRRLLPAW